MSLASDDIAAARAARIERERTERVSYDDARYELGVLGFGSETITRTLAAARVQGEVMTSREHVARVTYLDGVYTVTP